MSSLGTTWEAFRLLVRHAPAAYGVALLATAVNTVPDVLRRVLVRDDPRFPAALAVDVVGFLSGLLTVGRTGGGCMRTCPIRWVRGVLHATCRGVSGHLGHPQVVDGDLHLGHVGDVHAHWAGELGTHAPGRLA